MKNYEYIGRDEEGTTTITHFKNVNIRVDNHIDCTANMEAINEFLVLLHASDDKDWEYDLYSDTIQQLLNNAYADHGRIIDLRVFDAYVGVEMDALSPDAYTKVISNGVYAPIALWIDAQFIFGCQPDNVLGMAVSVDKVAHVLFNLCDLLFIGDDEMTAKFHANAYERFFTCNG